MTYVIESNHSLQYHPKLFDFPPAVTPAPPVPERNHPIHKHIRAQSEGHTIVNNVSPFNVTAARRTQSTFTKASPNGRVALLSTHSESRGEPESPSPPDSPRETRTAEDPANANANTNINTNSTSTSTSTSTPTSPASGTRSSRSSRQKSGSLSSTREADAPQAQAQAQAQVTRSSLSSPVGSSGKVRLQLGLPPKSSPRSSPRRVNRNLPNTQAQQSPPPQHTVIHPPASSPPTEYHSLPSLTHTPDTITPSLESHSTSTSTSTSASLPEAAAATATAAVESSPPVVDHVDSSPFPTQSSIVDESVTTPLFSDPPFPLSDEIGTRPMSSSTLDTIPIAATFHDDHSQHSNQLDPNS